ncbi:MAG: tetratricopeptide repeat protein [Rhodothermales bacterium]|nr:tetratricopeptide repeat protein [Rhodothermales bacterium]
MARFTLLPIVLVVAACAVEAPPAEETPTMLASTPVDTQAAPARATDPPETPDTVVPDTTEAQRLISMARLLERDGDTLEAESLYKRAHEDHPDYDRAVSEYGNFLMRAGRPEASMTFYRGVIDQNPESAVAHNGLATAMSALEWYDEALASAQEAVRLRPGYVDAMTNIGTMQVRLGDLETGAKTLREAAMLGYDQGNLTPVLNYGLVSLQMESWEEAIAALGRMVVTNPDHVQMRLLLAKAMIGKGDPISALAQVNAGLKREPEHAEALAMKAELEAAK